jgi:exodeoxyribonuclease-3
MRLATWNVNSLNVRLERVLSFLERQRPDVLCLQETKQTNDAFPSAAFEAAGYQAIHNGEGRWNGVALISSVGIEAPQVGFERAEDAYGARLIGANCGGTWVFSAYVPNGRSLDSEHFSFKLAWLSRLEELTQRFGANDRVAILGDFNIAPRDSDVWDLVALEGLTHVSEAERSAIAALESHGYCDVFADLHPEGGVYSWWDYSDGAFHKGHGMRIDLCMASASLAKQSVEAFVDRQERKGIKPSDHAPVVFDFS